MSKKRLKLGWFMVPDWKREEEWLRKQHRSGWALVSYFPPCFYTFQRCEPEDVVYQLDYNEQGLREKTSYVQMFRDCGWEYMFDGVGYSYFRKPASQMKNPEEIFCDEQSRLDMIRRVFKGRIVPLLILFFCVIIPQLFSTYHRALDDRGMRWIFCLVIIMFVLYLIIFINFAAAYFKLRKGSRE